MDGPVGDRQVLTGHVPAEIAELGLQPTGQLPDSMQMRLAIELRLPDKGALTRLLGRLYDPADPSYRQYLSPSEFAAQFAPSDEDYSAVAEFARSNRLSVVATFPNRLLLDVAGSAADVQRALHLRVLTYDHPTEDRTFFAPDSDPSLDLSVPLLHISGLDNYHLPQPASRISPAHAVPLNDQPYGTGTGPNGSFRGYDFRKAYLPGVSLDGAGQKVGILAYDSGFYLPDIIAYENATGLPAVPIGTVLLDGYGGGPGENPDEVELDIENVIAMAPGLDSVLVFEAPDVSTAFTDILESMALHPTIKQFSSSWMWYSDFSEGPYLQLMAQGQTIFNASGDDLAISDPTDTRCGRLGALTPYATIVGGTELTTDGTEDQNYVSEAVWNYTTPRIGSTGGYCDTMPIPSWQVGIANEDNQGSTVDRNIPDVACVGAHVWVYVFDFGGIELGGTSISAPLWAGFMALVNESTAAHGWGSVGWLNPALYNLATSAAGNDTTYFHDVTTGDNIIDGGDRFRAVPGYDLCTGWGTPRPALLDTLYALSAVKADGPRSELPFARVSPNPFREGCQIELVSRVPGTVTVRLLDAGGRSVRCLRTEIREAGRARLRWDGRDEGGRVLPAGVYFVRIQAPEASMGQKILLLR